MTYLKNSEIYSKKNWPQAKLYYLLPKWSLSLKNSQSDYRGRNCSVLWVLYFSKIAKNKNLSFNRFIITPHKLFSGSWLLSHPGGSLK